MNRFGQLVDRPQRRVPWSTKGIEFAQGQTLLAAELAKMAGGNYILSGCEANGNNVSAGTMILNDEVIPFVGGSLQTKIRIVERRESVTAGAETYDDLYIRRHAEFGSNLNDVDTFLWSDIVRLPTIKDLLGKFASVETVDEIRDMVMPKGAIIMWSGEIANIPAGFALCDGSTVGGVVTPNLRGRFIVGYDGDKVNTPVNSTNSTENYGKVGNTGGRNSVTLGTTEIPSHDHVLNIGCGLTRHSDSGTKYVPARNFAHTQAELNDAEKWTGVTAYSGGGQAHENRPAYYVLAFIMKVI
jgi:microcystin-dependent protein